MKIYRRDDGFEVQDANDRPIEWAVATYDGEEGDVANWVEVIPPPPPTAEEQAVKAEIAECRKFLAETDYKVIRQMETQEMSVADFILLKEERQGKRNRINELEV